MLQYGSEHMADGNRFNSVAAGDLDGAWPVNGVAMI
jgi:hypothetical protein